MDTPHDVPTVAQLHSLSVDLAATFLTFTDPNHLPWHSTRLPAYTALNARSSQQSDNTYQQQQQQQESEEQQEEYEQQESFTTSFDEACAIPQVASHLSQPCSSSTPSFTSLPIQFEQSLLLTLPSPQDIQTSRKARQIALKQCRQLRKETKEKNENLIDSSDNDISTGSDLTTPVSKISATDSSSSTDSAIYKKKGILKKKGRRTGMFRKRYFAIRNNTLYNYRYEYQQKPSWKLSLLGARIGTDILTNRIVLLVDGQRKLVLYAKDKVDMEQWANVLAKAADTSKFDVSRSNQFNARQQNKRNSLSHLSTTEASCTNIFDIDDNDLNDDVWDSFQSFSALQIRTNRAHSCTKEKQKT